MAREYVGEDDPDERARHLLPDDGHMSNTAGAPATGRAQLAASFDAERYS